MIAVGVSPWSSIRRVVFSPERTTGKNVNSYACRPTFLLTTGLRRVDLSGNKPHSDEHRALAPFLQHAQPRANALRLVKSTACLRPWLIAVVTALGFALNSVMWVCGIRWEVPIPVPLGRHFEMMRTIVRRTSGKSREAKRTESRFYHARIMLSKTLTGFLG